MKRKTLKERRKYRLSNRFLSFSLIITTSIVIAFAVFSGINEYNFFKEKAEQQREALGIELDSLLKYEVDKTIDYIRFTNMFSENKLRTELKSRGDQAWDIANNIYQENKNRPKSIIKKSIKDALRPIRFYNDRGYYFICSMDGIEELYPVRPDFEGVNVLNLQDVKGKYVIQKEIELLKHQDEGFIIDYWYKPGSAADSAYPKTSFVKRFDPLNWYIGCGEYLDNVENDLKLEIIEKLDRTSRLEKNYVFIYNREGKLILSPKNKDYQTEFINNYQTKIYSKIEHQIKRAETSFFSIQLLEEDSITGNTYNIHARKLPEWNWIVGSYSDISIIEDQIVDEKQFLREEIESRLLALTLFILIVVVIIFLLTKELQKIIRNAFINFSQQLSGMINEQRPIDPNKFQMENFSVMAEYANQLLEKQIKVQKAFDNSESKFQKIYQNAPVMILAIDQDMNLKLCNETCENFFGINAEKFIDKQLPLSRAIKAQDFEKLFSDLKLCDNQFREYDLHFKNGARYIQNWASFNTGDNLEFWIGYDLTDLKLAQKKIKERTAFLNILINTIPTPIFYKDRKGIYQGANSTFCEMIGRNPEDLIGKSVFDIAPKEMAEKYFLMDEELMEKRGSQVYEYNVMHADESVHDYIFYKKVYEDLSGNTGGIIGIMLDITDRKKVEEQLRELNITKDKFFSIIAHDLKNPFNSLLGLSDYLNFTFDDLQDEERKEIIKTVYNSANTIYKLLENLLQWARSQSGAMDFKPEQIDVYKLIDSSIQIIDKQAEEKRIIITNKLPENLLAFCDKQMISTVLRNLLNNAVKFTPENGSIVISHNIVDNDFIEISVKDSGIGMSHEIIEKLFRIDTKITTKGTNKETGTGLGLILCKEFVEKNDGKIGVESEPGKGSRFYFTLPVKKISEIPNG